MSDATGEMLLRAIIEDPDADDLRLIYADWLHDHGDAARAEFIRVQVRLAKMDADDPERPALEDREQELLDDHRENWLQVLPADAFNPDELYPRFRRGFLENLIFGGPAFVGRGEEVLRKPVERVTINEIATIGASATARLAACPGLGHVRRITLGNGDFDEVDAEQLATFLASPYLRGLIGLEINGSGNLGQVGAAAIARWPGAVSLRELAIQFGAIGPEGMAELVASPHLAGLRELQLHGCQIGSAGVRALVESGTFAHLRVLGLGYNRIDTEGIARLCQWSGLNEVEELSLMGNSPDDRGPGDAGVAELTTSADLSRLRTLTLRSSRITRAGARMLAECPRLGELRTLELAKNPLGPEGIEWLAASPHLGCVRRLGLDEVGVEDKGAWYLARAVHLRPVQVDLGHNQITRAGAALLLGSPFFEGVAELDAGRLEVDGAGVIALARNPAVRGLRRLDLSRCRHSGW
jgi:uncharacterized protein (TIGR02996 family)